MLRLCLAVTVIAGCASDSGLEQEASIPSAPAAPEQPRESPSEARLDHAIDVRTLLGLRADPPFVHALFSDSAAVERGLASAYGIPLTGLELERLETIKQGQDTTIPAVERYAATVPEAYAGSTALRSRACVMRSRIAFGLRLARRDGLWGSRPTPASASNGNAPS